MLTTAQTKNTEVFYRKKQFSGIIIALKLIKGESSNNYVFVCKTCKPIIRCGKLLHTYQPNSISWIHLKLHFRKDNNSSSSFV